jgi:hypothetical protein
MTQGFEPFASLFDGFLGRGEVEAACGIAMRAAEALLADAPAERRRAVFDRFFRPLDKGYLAQYQSYDFEICDYGMFAFRAGGRLFRGPRPAVADLAAGHYITLLGAAQLFGRFHARPFHVQLAEQTGMPVLNLSVGGAGPESFLAPPVIAAANRGRAVILQILSGRSIGCDEYPGQRLTARAGSGDRPMDRIALLKRIHATDPAEAMRLVRKWQGLYVARMIQLIEALRVPVHLVWMSSRQPGDWRLGETADFGAFPQLVEEPMLAALAAKTGSCVTLDPDPAPVLHPVSRLNGERCPFFLPDGTLGWEQKYYPSMAPHLDLLARVPPDWARDPGQRLRA